VRVVAAAVFDVTQNRVDHHRVGDHRDDLHLDLALTPRLQSLVVAGPASVPEPGGLLRISFAALYVWRVRRRAA
jgi:hypothetical protein